MKQAKKGKEVKPTEGMNSHGELYSESSHYESVNGQYKQYVVEKVYRKDGQLLTVKREEKQKGNGKVEVTETIDNGKELKRKIYLQESDVKKLNS